MNLFKKIFGGLIKELRPTPSPFSPPSNDPNVAIIAEPKVSYVKLALIILALAGWGWKVYTAIKTDQPIPVVPDLNFKPAPVDAENLAANGPSFGWQRDDEAVAKVLAKGDTPEFASTPAGKAVLGNDDAFHWRAVRKAAGKGEDWYPNVNQKSVGCCVGCGYKHGVDTLQGVQIAIMGLSAEWKPVSVEGIYAASRVDVGGGQIRGDGSVGAWAKQAIGEEGVLAMQKYDEANIDLSVFDPLRAREWGRTGIPSSLKNISKQHLVKKASIVRSFDEVKKAIQQGYPVPVCSNVGFDNPDGSPGTRDKDGFCKPRGTWPHCMVFIGYRSGPREGIFCLNSWGNEAHKGPVWPADAPVAGFWIDPQTVDRMAKQGDTFAISAIDGFPARENLDWLVKVEPRRRNNLRIFDAEYALAP